MLKELYIGELLFRYDCVIVPGLGGFVTNYAPSQVHPTQHVFTPPSKNIIFNKNLKNNDGLLVSHLAETLQTDYSTAAKQLQEFVEHSQKELLNGRKVEFKNVGVLYLDIERNIQFEVYDDYNYLPGAFGLSPVQSPAIKRDNYVKRIEKELKDRKPIPQKKPKRKIGLKRYSVLTGVVILLGIFTWLSFQNDTLKNLDYSSINPFREKTPAVYVQRTEEHTTNYLAEKAVVSPALDTTASAVATLSFLEDNTPGIPVKLTAELTPVHVQQPETTRVTKAVTAKEISLAQGRYHIVVGCFQIPENAHNYISTLQTQNVTASIIGQTKTGLHIVSSGGYASRTEAFKALALAKSVSPQAWLMVK